ncbi:MAG TPA: isochorismatase family protein [Oscillospiraceae bacterium]|nr:isochorismatase family protein [Oscillospiraceae bacterium]
MENLHTKDCLNPEKVALVIIDLQNGVVNSRKHAPYTGEQVVANASRLTEAFTEKGAFVVLVKVSTHDGKDMLRPKTDFKMPPVQFEEGWDRHVPELARHTGAYIITKKQMGAFFGTNSAL